MAAERAGSISPPSLAQDPNLNAIRERASEPGSKYAFLVHSTDSLKNGEDPSIDNKPLARQRRRRTSPEDQAVLEAAFMENPKPDKAARVALVDKVALGEKEVQIWFQNRRQSTRRKQRPLEPHEIPSLAQINGYSSPYSPTGPADSQSHPQHDSRFIDDGPVATSTHLGRLSTSPIQSRDSLSNNNPVVAGGKAQVDVTDATAANSHGDKAHIEIKDNSASIPAIPTSSQQQQQQQQQALFPPPSSQESNSERWLSNRRSAAPFRSFHESMSQLSEPDSQPPPATQESAKNTSRHGLTKSTSSIRLSFGADGTAIVRNGDSPSPPRKLLPPPITPAQSVPAPRLHRTYSSASLNEPGSQESNKSSSLRRVSSFRSHDSRTWEFFCDRDVRGELGERAEQEQSGSAADAIKLARSNSAKATLGRSLSGKRTMTPYAEVSSAKRAKTTPSAPSSTSAKDPVRPLQQKSLSASNPRRVAPSQTPGQKPPLHKTPKLKQTPTFEFSATDSDKENWSPEHHLSFIQSMITSPAMPPSTSVKRRAPVAHTPLRRGVTPSKPGGGGGGSSNNNNANAIRHRRGRIDRTVVDDHRDNNDDVEDEDDEDDEEEEDDEVARFMGTTGGGGGGDGLGIISSNSSSSNSSSSSSSSSSRRDRDEKRARRQSASVSEEEDLAGVQGLLSLSQGAWR